MTIGRPATALLLVSLLASVAGAGVPLITFPEAPPPDQVPTVAFRVPGKPEPAGSAKPEQEARPRPGPLVSVEIPRYQLPVDELELLASCLVLEAASQGDFGMRGVMAVIRNRAQGRPELFVPTILRQKQFSALNAMTSGQESRWRLVRRAQRDRMWDAAVQIVTDATRDDWHDPTGGATHYTRTGEHTRWTGKLARTVTIGRHAFYR